MNVPVIVEHVDNICSEHAFEGMVSGADYAMKQPSEMWSQTWRAKGTTRDPRHLRDSRAARDKVTPQKCARSNSVPY